MKRMQSVLVGVLLLAATAGLGEANPVGMAFLRIGAGADAIGMADAVVSNVDGPNATYWNPGALAFIPGFQATAVHNESFQSVRQEFGGIVRNFGSIGAGLSFLGTWTDNMDGYDESANFLGEFGYYSLAVAGTGGYRINDTWGAGLGVKYLREVIETSALCDDCGSYDASGFAFDFGIQGRQLLSRFDVGLSILHLGSSMEFIDEPFDLPLTLQGGVTYHLPLASVSGEAIFAAEVRKIRDEDAGVNLGAEYRIQELARMRIGYRSGLDTEDVSFGLGLTRGRVQVDYAYVPFGEDLGNQHRVGLTYRR